MKLDLTSLSFNSSLQEGIGTPSWGTALGQSEGYKITANGASELLLGMFNNKIDNSNLEHNFRGEKDILIAACFSYAIINEIKINKPFILAIVEENTQSHYGRKSLKYNDKLKFSDGKKNISNKVFYSEAQSKLGKNACWFVHEINIEEGNHLKMKAVIVDDKPVKYLNSKIRKDAWSKLIGIVDSTDKSENNFNDKLVSNFKEKTFYSGLIFSHQLVQRFTASLCTKPFVIYSGLTGSGKTKLAQAFVRWISENKNQYKIIPVGADWTNREPLLGFPNGLNKKEYILPDSGALQIILEAQKEENEKKPYFLILDEMNLSHVERYFADFLSIMESKDSIKLYSGEQRYSEYKEDDETFNLEHVIPKEITWPKNLFIIGTVNIDETTYMFSPKVLDRANVIEFRINQNEMKDYLDNSGELKLEKLHVEENKDNPGLGAQFGESFVSLAKDKESNNVDVSVLNDFFKELQEVGAEFGYRSASEIKLLISNLSTNDNFITSYLKGELKKETITSDDLLNHKIDIAIMQKLLPKLHGSRKKLVKPLDKLASLCINRSKERKNEDSDRDKSNFTLYLSDSLKTSVNLNTNWIINYPISFEKIKRMHKNLLENGFVSYAEA
jgi:5-methylcytosine-specific restriction enzyme B